MSSYKKTDYGYKDAATILLENRIIMLNGEVNEASAYHVTSLLHILNQEQSKKPIQLIINSPGGSCIDGLAIIDTMRFIQKTTPISTICTGLAASMGFVILSAGTPGLRMSMPNARLLAHQASSGMYQQNIQDMRIEMEATEQINNRLLQIISKNCDITLDELKEKTLRDYWLWAEDGLPGKFGKKGVIDKIVDMGDLYVPEEV